MTSSKLINYTTREFMSENELELYATKQDEIFTPKVIDEFKKAGMFINPILIGKLTFNANPEIIKPMDPNNAVTKPIAAALPIAILIG